MKILLRKLFKLIINQTKSCCTEEIWLRYVNDGLCVSNKKNKYSKEIYKELNKLHASIKFSEK